MNLPECIQRLQAQLSVASTDDESVLRLLYEVFSESNAMYDDEVKAGFNALYEAMSRMPLREMDQIGYPVCTLCRDYKKTGFKERAGLGSICALNLLKIFIKISRKTTGGHRC